LFVGYLIDRYAQKAGKKIQTIKKETLAQFEAYDWPRNIRELQNVIERAVIVCDGETFSFDESGGVSLVDVEVIRFLGTCQAKGIRLVHCSPYIGDWINKEQGREK